MRVKWYIEHFTFIVLISIELSDLQGKDFTAFPWIED